MAGEAHGGLHVDVRVRQGGVVGAPEGVEVQVTKLSRARLNETQLPTLCVAARPVVAGSWSDDAGCPEGIAERRGVRDALPLALACPGAPRQGKTGPLSGRPCASHQARSTGTSTSGRAMRSPLLVFGLGTWASSQCASLVASRAVDVKFELNAILDKLQQVYSSSEAQPALK